MKRVGHFIAGELFPAKTVSARWPDTNRTKVDLTFPMAK